jgi:hypothetical protein
MTLPFDCSTHEEWHRFEDLFSMSTDQCVEQRSFRGRGEWLDAEATSGIVATKMRVLALIGRQ